MEMNSDSSVWFETENEDDTFYDEIKRQILLLTSEEDNEDLVETNSFRQIDVTNDGSNRSIYNYNNATKPTRKFYLWETDSSGSPPIWLTNLWRNGKGTGVFIPQVSCKENQRPARMNNRTRKIYRPVVNKK
ncbi:hypothetical protein MtrunA17_Chr1g0210141 [Medicago truncatula]|uniref:Uncharacterized protein n=1 Tax=Medicago truncatula TaxID=3880 RepID=G7ZZA3_MEDTR|nr:uncharacterized protein LOC25485526 [Medicago truncatula]KEH44252.1 hypothetical protein MTR_1g111300 [Medicago truncatula]RHN82460.1 hypothetical protein MtrunA17_Chr1g0210141 [Medicago truncatula]